MRILPPLYRDTAIIGSIEEFPRKPLFHRVFRAPARTRNEPAYSQCLAPVSPHFDRNLVGGATDPARAHFDSGAHIAERVVEDAQGILAAALGDPVESAIDDPLGDRFLALVHQAIHKFGQDAVAEFGVRQDLAFDRSATARHDDLPTL